MEPVYFNSRNEQPYGVFSNFSAHPIWIAGRRYQTVEHWYQSAKASTATDHDWIAEAATPEEAKKRGRAISPKPGWEQQRLLTMYRGVLAKYRQHPLVGDLLVSTKNAPIHEASDDVFWGAHQGGADWLGRLLVWVRSQLHFLGAFDAGPLFEMIKATPLMRYQMAAAIRQIRNQGEAWLIHLVRHRSDTNPSAILSTILESGLLKASMQLGGCVSVSFTGLARQALEDRVFGPEATLRTLCGAYDYSPFGIAVKFDFAREYGFQPALALEPSLAKRLPHSSSFLASIYSATECFDYAYEDEWRYPTDLDLREGPFAAVVPDQISRRLQLLELWNYPIDELVRRINT